MSEKTDLMCEMSQRLQPVDTAVTSIASQRSRHNNKLGTVLDALRTTSDLLDQTWKTCLCERVSRKFVPNGQRARRG